MVVTGAWSRQVRLRVDAPGGVLRAQAGGAVEIDGRGRETLAQARRLQHPLAVLVDVAAAVEDQPVVGARRDWRRRTSTGCRRRGWRSARAGSAPRPAGTARRRRCRPARRRSRCGAASALRGSRGPRRPRARSCRSRSGRRDRQTARRGHPRRRRARRGRRSALRRRRCRWAASLSGSAIVCDPPATVAAQL